MSAVERSVSFASGGATLVGIAHVPSVALPTGVVMVVGGPQYRVGSHRQFVLVARALAAAGHAVLRFDYSGMGDSTGTPRDFQSVSADIAAAIGALQHCLPNVRQVALWGLCDGASAALLYVDDSHDARVVGLCLLNPWVRSEISLARTQVRHYYRQRLMQREFWLKLISGKVAAGSLRGLMQGIRAAHGGAATASDERSFQDRMADAWCGFGGEILLFLSGDDFTAKEFADYSESSARWARAWRHPRLTTSTLDGADHTFSNAVARAHVEHQTSAWLLALAQTAERSGGRAAATTGGSDHERFRSV